MFAYIDESGHTGTNLFDPIQPYFFNAAMSSETDFDIAFGQEVSQIAERFNLESLHAREIGPDGVEAIANSVGELVKRSQVKFHFVVANKQDNAILQFFYAVFDPFENPAAHPTWFWIRLLRFGLVGELGKVMAPTEAKKFWEAMTTPKSKENEAKAKQAIDNVLGRLDRISDPRPKQLISDTLTWARNNIEQFSFWSSEKNAHQRFMPNLYTLPELFARISDDAENWNIPVAKIVHDRQFEFEANIVKWHSLFRNLQPETELNWGDTISKVPDVSQSVFEFSDARSSPALQIVDIVLWVFARFTLDKLAKPASLKLFEQISSIGDTIDISLNWINTEFAIVSNLKVNQPISDGEMRAGIQLTEQMEAQRQTRIRDVS